MGAGRTRDFACEVFRRTVELQGGLEIAEGVSGA